MRDFVGSAIGLLVGGALAWISIYGLVQSQTSSDGQSPVNASQATIDYGTNG